MELHEKYPKLFTNHPTFSDCGEGWYPLINTLCAMLSHNVKEEDKFQVEQIKEKFGTLRFYTNDYTDYQRGLIDLAEAISGTICEECGAPGKRTTGGWIRTLCDKHAEEFGYYTNEKF